MQPNRISSLALTAGLSSPRTSGAIQYPAATVAETAKKSRRVADVDANQLKRAENAFKEAKPYADFRVMLDEMGKSIDAVTVSTPDHVHVTAAAMSMNLGKHCFCQKPLTRSIAEALVTIPNKDSLPSRPILTIVGVLQLAAGGILFHERAERCHFPP